MNVLEALYNAFVEEEHKDSEAAVNALNLCDEAETVEKSKYILGIVCEGLDAERKVGFFAGFNTAVKLLMGGRAV